MALTLRKNLSEPLSTTQMDGNFEYFTGSHAITGSLVVSGGITGSLLGTSSTASFATLAQTASYVTTAQTASYINPTFISASAAASGFGSGGTSIDTSSFATTGSNVFVGNQTISGSINFGSGSIIQSTGSTLELTPDPNLGTDQYIILDPTGPNHIHIRAGGAIDSSSADLYLGGEKSNIIVRNLDNGFNEKYWVQINSQTGSTLNTWTFDDDGTTSFPGDISTSGNITANSFTGSLEGTASYTENAATSSYVNTLNQDVIISGSILISGSLIPDTDGVSVTSSFDLGSPTNAWKDIYVSNGTINFLDGAGNVQGTVGAGAAGTVITGALNVISYGDEELNLETQGYNGVFSKLSKQKLTSAGIKLAADYSTGLSLNYGLYTYFGDPILPWDKKINTFYVYNNLSSSVSPSLLYLPPINNAPYTPGEIITVYNISPSASSNIRNSGSLKISCFAQGILGVDTGSKNVTSAQNTQCPILSGSWGDFKSINPSSGYSASLEILPGKKVSFEVINWGNFSIGTSSNYPFYNGNFSGDGYSDATYGAIYKLISISDI